MSTAKGSSLTRRGVLAVALHFRLGARLQPATDKPKTRQQQEAFLSQAELLRIDLPYINREDWARVTLRSGDITHNATFRTMDRTPMDPKSYRESWMFDVAAYRLDLMLELGMVPATVERMLAGKRGSLVWWVDDVLMDEGSRAKKNLQPPDLDRWQNRMRLVRLFDELICNRNRNKGNLLIDKDWNPWLIDHCRCFGVRGELQEPKAIVLRDQQLMNRLNRLSAASIQARMGDYLLGPEIAALLARRDRIIEILEGRNSVACD